MEKKDIVQGILSGDAGKVSQAKVAIKEMLSQSFSTLKVEAQKFTTKKLLENHDSDYGPFPVGTHVQDKVKGIVGTVVADPHNSGHPVTVQFADKTTCHYGPEEIKNLVKHFPEMNGVIDSITGNRG